MPKAYEVEGTRYEFPDNFTDEQAQEILTKQGIIKPPNPNRAASRIEDGVSVGGFLKNALNSAGTMAGDAVQAVAHPIDTISNIASVAHGGAVRAAEAMGFPGQPNPQRDAHAQAFDGLADHYRQRYGSLKAVAKSLYEDPAGAALDASMVLEGGGSLLRGAGKLGRSSALVKAGEAAGKAGEAVNPARVAVAAAAKGAEAVKTAAPAAKKMIFKPPTPSRAMTMALKPASNNLRFSSDINKALPELKAAESAMGKPISGVEDMAEAVKIAKRNIWSQYEQVADGQKAARVNLTPVADAMARSISRKTWLEEPEAASRMLERANKYRNAFTMEEAEDLLRTTNAELHSSKYPTARQIELRANPDTAMLESQAKALRDTIYKHLDESGHGTAPRELMRRYGSLMNVEHEIERRINVAQRQAPESLSQQLSKWHAAGEAARGAGRILIGDLGGAGDIAGAIAKRKVADWLKQQNTSDALIRDAFANFKGTPEPVIMPQRRPVAGLLTEGSLKTPPPADTSGIVRDAPGPTILAPDPVTNPARLLPSPSPAPKKPLVTPPPADTSRVRTVPAKSHVVRDPKTGKFKRVFTSEGKNQ